MGNASRGELGAAGIAPFVNEFPKVFGFSQFIVFGNWHFGAKEEIGKGAAMQYAMHDDGGVFHFKIEAPIAGAEAIELLAVALDEAKLFAIQCFEVVLIDLKFIQQRELRQSIHPGHLGGTDFVEDDLQHERVGE